MFLLPHILIWIISFYHLQTEHGATTPAKWIAAGLFLLVYTGITFLIHLMPYRLKGASSLRLTILGGGRKILKLCFYGILFQIFFYLVMELTRWPILPQYTDESGSISILVDMLICILHFYLLLFNACVRILCCCRRLGIVKRLLIILWLWIPIFNLFLLRYLSKMAKEEIDLEICRFENRKERDGSQLCATKYPLILLHGIGFRDLKYFNYWGRIPSELVRNGAIIYYGHQQAWGTIEDNALIIKEKIEEVLKENNCDKVNIIAHSKGGLDARYLISGLHMEDKIASLTTMSTPHRGSELLNFLNRLPDGLYRLIASCFDKSFGKFGDKNPDCYHSSKQLSPSFCQAFNEKYPDAPGVYYQSYASIVKHTLGDGLLSIPNLVMFLLGAPKNDGLVSVESARWGDFQETFVSSGWRGISHGDMIDLKREDYKGFDVIETYVTIVARLKNLGF